MANVGTGTVRLIDSDGDAMDTGGALKVQLVDSTDNIDIGNVDLMLDGGTAVLGNAGDVAAGVLRVTLANDDVHFGAVGGAADVDGTIHGQLRYIGETIESAIYVDDADWDGSSKHMLVGGLYGSNTITSGDVGPIALAADGAVHIDDGGNTITVDGTITANAGSGTLAVSLASVPSHAVTNAGTFAVQESGDALTALQLIDNSIFVDNAGFTLTSSSVNVAGGVYQNGTPGTLGDNDAGAILLNSTSGQMVELMASTAAIGKVGHDITGIVSDRDVDVGTTAEKIHTASDVAIKRIDIQAAPANTGYIFVGDGGVAGDGTGGGIRLAAGDFYSLDIDNTGDVYVAASEANEDVYYTYYT